jgi:hypothetical protein
MGILKSRTRLLVVAAFLLLTFLGAAYAVYAVLRDSPEWQFSGAYSQLELGMTEDAVRGVFGPTPDFDCRYKSSWIWYYRGPGFFTGDFEDVELERGATVQSLDDLPDVYDHVQLAFDSEGRLHAYTWIGEAYTVESTSGSVSGSHFRELPDSDF